MANMWFNHVPITLLNFFPPGCFLTSAMFHFCLSIFFFSCEPVLVLVIHYKKKIKAWLLSVWQCFFFKYVKLVRLHLQFCARERGTIRWLQGILRCWKCGFLPSHQFSQFPSGRQVDGETGQWPDDVLCLVWHFPSGRTQATPRQLSAPQPAPRCTGGDGSQ